MLSMETGSGRTGRRGLLVIRMRGADPLVARRELAVESDLVERFTVDRQIEGLTYLDVGERAFALVVIGIDGEAKITELGCCRQHKPGVRLHILEIGGEHALDQIEPA